VSAIVTTGNEKVRLISLQL